MDAIGEARGLLPWWVGWGPLIIWPGIAVVLTMVLGLVACLVGGIHLRLYRGDDWVERARRAWPLRQAMLLCAIVLPIVFGVSAYMHGGVLLGVSHTAIVALAAGASFAVMFFFVTGVFRRLKPAGAGWGTLMRSAACVLLLRYRHIVLVVVAAFVMPGWMNAAAIAMLAVLAGLLVLSSSFSGLGLARTLGLARRAPVDLESAVMGEARHMGVTVRGVWVVPWAVSNALAFPIPREIAFTEDALAILDGDEIRAVTAHELGHVSEPRLVKLARASITMVLLPLAAAGPITGTWGVLGVIVALALAFVVILVFRRIAVRLEKRADAAATGAADAVAYARALEKLYRANLMPAVLRVGRSHPNLYDRMVDAGVTPSWKKPKPPPRFGALAALTLVIIVSASVGLGSVYALHPLKADWCSTEHGCNVVMATQGADAWSLDTAGNHMWRRGDVEGALGMFGAACASEPYVPHYCANLAIVLSGRDRCREAGDALVPDLLP